MRSPNNRALLYTPTIGMARVLIAAIVAGNIPIKVYHTKWHTIIGTIAEYAIANKAIVEMGPISIPTSKINIPKRIGMPPKINCHPVKIMIGVVQLCDFINTVPMPQKTAAAKRRKVPPEVPSLARSGPISMRRPDNPMVNPTVRARVNLSPKKITANIVAQSGIV